MLSQNEVQPHPHHVKTCKCPRGSHPKGIGTVQSESNLNLTFNQELEEVFVWKVVDWNYEIMLL